MVCQGCYLYVLNCDAADRVVVGYAALAFYHTDRAGRCDDAVLFLYVHVRVFQTSSRESGEQEKRLTPKEFMYAVFAL